MKNTIAAVLTTILVSGMAVLGFTAMAQATAEKPWICHPVEGKGETGYGWNLINPAKASIHIDEATGAGKHTRKDGTTDVYATVVNGEQICPGMPFPEPTETVEPTPTETETVGEPTPVIPTWSIPFGCNGNGSWYRVVADDTVAYDASWIERGRIVDFTFTANAGYTFAEGRGYIVSDDGMYASARGFIVIPRCGTVVTPEPDPTPEPEPKDNPVPVTETQHIYKCGKTIHLTVTRLAGKVIERERTVEHTSACDPKKDNPKTWTPKEEGL